MRLIILSATIFVQFSLIAQTFQYEELAFRRKSSKFVTYSSGSVVFAFHVKDTAYTTEEGYDVKFPLLKKRWELNLSDSTVSVCVTIDKSGLHNLVANYKDKPDWIITGNSKVINGQNCLEALIGPSQPTRDWVRAWYDPKVPLPIGPEGYWGLPGIIVRLESERPNYYIQLIGKSLDSPVIECLSDAIVVTSTQIIRPYNIPIKVLKGKGR